MAFRHILEYFFLELAIHILERMRQADFPCLSMRIPAIKWRGMTIHIECEMSLALLWVVQKKFEAEITSSARDLFNISKNKILHQFILKMFLPIEKLDGLVDPPLPVAPSN